MKASTQLKALIRNLSKEKNVEAEIILRNYMLERLLERISLSQYKNNFILKGGMLVAAMVGIDTRATMDMDATIKGQELSTEEIKNIFGSILSSSIDDGVNMSLKNIENIHDESEYHKRSSLFLRRKISCTCLLFNAGQSHINVAFNMVI